METLTELLQSWGVLGLIVAAFTESFCSPILPDLILIPLALATPQKAIYYGLLTTVVSVLGGIIGYWLGQKIGLPAAQKLIPAKYTDMVSSYAKDNAAWAVFLAAMSPIPYKFVSITAGALGIKMSLFLAASFFGRAKRFLLEGIIIYYFGPSAMSILAKFSDNLIVVSIIIVVVSVLLVVGYKKYKKNTAVLECKN
ncbi:YqaA family protein [Dendrosporobacter sp. 1207_IL3150]|uniref:YqaA family protein n=1 Tax=Dendrosporobacter sp. 1207_IL3150 TaxID=3084054 RepID=UPI002FD917E9